MTGWTPDVLADLPERFRDACHWRLFAGTLAGPDGLPSGEIPKGASDEVKLSLLRQKAELARARGLLFPEDD